MKKITAKKFLAMIAENPSVFEHWDTRLEITDHVYCQHSRITHLSPHLIFPRNQNGDSAAFLQCKHLKIATGTFHGCVSFAESGIEKIEELFILRTNTNDWAASFLGCKSLKIATGNYPGFVNFEETGIESIQNLHIENPDSDYFADFSRCPNLHTLEGWDLSKQICIEDEKWDAEKNRRAALQKYIEKTKPENLPFL
jgi:hypothetical protein